MNTPLNQRYKFAVEISRERYADGVKNEYRLAITHNGFQWQVIGVTLRQAVIIRDKLDAFIKAEEK